MGQPQVENTSTQRRGFHPVPLTWSQPEAGMAPKFCERGWEL